MQARLTEFTPEVEHIVGDALDQRDQAIEALRTMQAERNRIDQDLVTIKTRAEAQMEFFEQQRESMESHRESERSQLMNRFANATRQMLQQIDTLGDEVRCRVN